MKKKNIYIYSLIIAVITWISLVIPFQDNRIIHSFRIIFGSIFILFLPGFFLTLNFFKKKEIDFLERWALSFALSISIVPLLSFYLNLIGLKINELSIFIITLWIIILNILYIQYKKIWKKI